MTLPLAKRPLAGTLAAALVLAPGIAVRASDHLDSPAVVADPRMDIGDLYAWTSSNGLQLNLAMTIVGHSFSSAADYIFHIDSGERYGQTTSTSTIVCRFTSMRDADCRVGTGDRIAGDPRSAAGLAGRHGRSRLFAGLRDDPFFNNVKGSRHAFEYAAAALRSGVKRDEAGCPLFSREQKEEMLNRWRHTQGGTPQDFLAGWTPASIVMSVDLGLVNQGGKILAVWGEVSSGGKRIDRAARPLTGNALLAPLGPNEISESLKDKWNQAAPSTSGPFVSEIEKSLALYDGYDGQCGTQLLAETSGPPAERYRALASMLADDRLWINSASSVCTQMFGVELAAITNEEKYRQDCGGRSPIYDAANVYRSLLATGSTTGIDDGLRRDAMEHSAKVFPFLAAPVAEYSARK